ncbi:hypothetical protein Ahy_A05g025512 isoform D [Arachis hypogaea]|uniref:Uncharacterized protein n=1 Tax=Arachis hypogaea TaxID=3818 RepID=A0A445D8W8_ARAHY|nr:hypothetical protein Ahy_A05g025512 isoform D [Arachis hypogaea]
MLKPLVIVGTSTGLVVTMSMEFVGLCILVR